MLSENNEVCKLSFLGRVPRASARIKYTQMTPDFCSPILYKIRQGASDSATLLVVISDATQNTDKKTSKIVYFILAEALNRSRPTA